SSARGEAQFEASAHLVAEPGSDLADRAQPLRAEHAPQDLLLVGHVDPDGVHGRAGLASADLGLSPADLVLAPALQGQNSGPAGLSDQRAAVLAEHFIPGV